MYKLDLITWEGTEKVQVGLVNAEVPPRIGETIWLQHRGEFGAGRQESWKITDICYWAPRIDEGENDTVEPYNRNMTMHSVAVYVERIT